MSSVCPRVRLCVPCVSRLPPVSLYGTVLYRVPYRYSTDRAIEKIGSENWENNNNNTTERREDLEALKEVTRAD